MPTRASSSDGIARFEVVVVPFPFTDRGAAKRRPALVLSSADAFNRIAGHSVRMITSVAGVAWPLDVALEDLASAGLPSPSFVRMKLFTLDHRFVLRRAGRLAACDATAVEAALAALFSSRAARAPRS